MAFAGICTIAFGDKLAAVFVVALKVAFLINGVALAWLWCNGVMLFCDLSLDTCVVYARCCFNAVFEVDRSGEFFKKTCQRCNMVLIASIAAP